MNKISGTINNPQDYWGWKYTAKKRFLVGRIVAVADKIDLTFEEAFAKAMRQKDLILENDKRRT